MGSYWKNFTWGAAATIAVNFLNIAVSIFSIPLLLGHFKEERYAILILIINLLAQLSNSGFGLPTAMTVLTAKCLSAQGQSVIVRRSFCLVAALSTLMLLIFWGLTEIPGWIGIFGKIPGHCRVEAEGAAFWAGVLFLVNQPFSLFISAFTSYHLIYIERTYFSINLLVHIGCVLWVVFTGGTLADFAIMKGTLTILVSMAAGVHLFLFTRKRIRTGNIASSPVEAYSGILKTGARFFLMGLASTVVWSSDPFVISHNLGLVETARYANTFRLIAFSFMLFTTFPGVLSPMMATRYSLGQTEWVNRVYNDLLVSVAITAGFCWLGFIGFSDLVITLWIGSAQYDGLLTVFAIGGYGYILSMVHCHNSVYSGLNLIDRGFFVGMSEAAVKLFASLLLVRVLGSGGVALGTLVGASLTVLWMLPYEIRRLTGGKIYFQPSAIIRHAFCVMAPTMVCAMAVKTAIREPVIQYACAAAIIAVYTYLSWRHLPEIVRSKILNSVRPGTVST